MAQAIHGFRRLCRASKTAFKGDQYALNKAMVTLKQEFLKHKYVTDKTELGTIIDTVIKYLN